MNERYYSQQELCNAVYEAVLNARKPVSRLDIARAIGRKKSPHILAMIEHLTRLGYFRKGEAVTKRGTPVLTYEIAGEAPPDCNDIAAT